MMCFIYNFYNPVLFVITASYTFKNKNRKFYFWLCSHFLRPRWNKLALLGDIIYVAGSGHNSAPFSKHSVEITIDSHNLTFTDKLCNYVLPHICERLYADRLSYRVFTRSSKRPALARVFWIHLLEVCWTFAGSCKHPITVAAVIFCLMCADDKSSTATGL